MSIKVEQFSKDHWSTFAYFVSLCIDAKENIGKIEKSRMRTNSEKHPLLGIAGRWKPEYSTRLTGFFEFNEKQDYLKCIDAGLMILGHDDWDCLNDLSNAGFVEIVSQNKVKITDAGMKVSGELQSHKMKGGFYSNFLLK